MPNRQSPRPHDAPVRAALIGVGGISPLHAEGYRRAGAEIVALCDTDEDTLARRAREWAVPATYRDAARMFADVTPDVVTIATPVSTHHALVLKAAEAGVHVLCEKPISLDLRRADEMIEACHRAGVVLQVGHQLRSDGAVAHAKRLMSDGVIGEIAFVRLRQAHDWGGAREVRTSFATRESGGGGTLLDNGCHMMDLARFFAGDVEEVYARVAHRKWPVELEDTSLVSLRFASGALGSIENAWTATGWEEGFWIYGSEGSLEYTNRHQDPVLRHAFRASPGTTWADTDVSETRFAGDRAHYRQVRAFLGAVRGERDVICRGEDGREAVRLVLAAYDSAGANRPVDAASASVSMEATPEPLEP